MLKKLSTALFHYRYIGTYIVEKLYKSIIYFFLICSLMFIPHIMILTLDESLDRMEVQTVELLIENSDKQAKIEDFKLTSDNEFCFETKYYYYSFDENYISIVKPTFLFMEDSLVYVYTSFVYDEISYEELNLESLTINKDSKFDEIETLVNACEKIRKENEIKIKVSEGFLNLNMVIVNYVITVVVLFFITKFGNRNLSIKHRLIIAIYASTSNIVCDFFYTFTGIKFIQILGLILCSIATYIASKSIVAVKRIGDE